MTSLAKHLANKFNPLNLLLPSHCLICGENTDGENLCSDCKEKIRYLEYPLIEHKKNIYFYAITEYKGTMEKSIKILKFRKRKIIAKDLANIIIDFVSKEKMQFEHIGFVPMTPPETRERGFNQTYLMAKEISKANKIPILNGLKKTKETKKQVGLNKRERKENLKSAFKMTDKIEGNIVIIDDVYTTGNTAAEITKAIARKTKSNIYFIALARKIN